MLAHPPACPPTRPPAPPFYSRIFRGMHLGLGANVPENLELRKRRPYRVLYPKCGLPSVASLAWSPYNGLPVRVPSMCSCGLPGVDSCDMRSSNPSEDS